MRYNGGTIRKRGASWQADFSHAYSRGRVQFRTLNEAKGYIDGKRLEVLRLGAPLPAVATEHAADALARLPAGVTIRDAVDFWLQAHPADCRPVRELVKAYVEDRRAAGRRPRTLEALESRLGAFAGKFGDRAAASILPAELAEWLRRWQGRTRVHYHSIVGGFFESLVRSGVLVRNPARAVPRVAVDQATPGILTPDQARAVLAAAVKLDGRVAACVALGMFGGLRAAEVQGLGWSAVDLDHARVTVAPAIAKGRRVRHVTISANLAAWLRAFPGSGPVAPPAMTFRRRMVDVARESGVEIPHNAFRHSFCSYHLALHQDATRTAFELGHTQPAVLYAHYRALVTPEAAAQFWGILPPASPAPLPAPPAAKTPSRP